MDDSTGTRAPAASTTAGDEPVTTAVTHEHQHSSRRRRFRFRPRFTPLARGSLAARLVTILTLALPPILYLISFALTLSLINNPDYVAADVLVQNPDDGTVANINKTHFASPWFSCRPDDQPANASFGTYTETCTRRDAVGSKGLASCISLEHVANFKICDKITSTAELYTAGAVLVGCAFLASAMYAIFAAGATGMGPGYHGYHAVPSSEATRDKELKREEHVAEVGLERGHGLRAWQVVNNAFGAFAALMALAGAMCLVMGQILGYASMIIESSVSGVGGNLGDISRFYMSTGLLQYTSAAYGLTFVGAFIVVTGCGLHR